MPELRLELILKKKKLSKRQFARLLKTDTGTLSKYFKGTGNPTLLTLEKWAKLLNVKVRDLIKE
jgi:transcriptional regulator with XRE-family HTH domain